MEMYGTFYHKKRHKQSIINVGKHLKLNITNTNPITKLGMNSCAPDSKHFLFHLRNLSFYSFYKHGTNPLSFASQIFRYR